MRELTLNVEPREKQGRQECRRLRQEGKLPANVYGESGPISLAVDTKEFTELWDDVLGTVTFVRLKGVDGDKRVTIIQEVQREATTDKFVHVDFREVTEGSPLVAKIRVHLVGEAVGVASEGGTLEHRRKQLEVRCLPKDLPEYIEVDVSGLHTGENIQLRDLVPPAGVSFLGQPTAPIASCAGARVSRGAMDAVDEEGGGSAEGEEGEGGESAEEASKE